jgi:hypothetical protein
MKASRKIQVSAGIVIINGLSALALTAPRLAVAAQCNDFNFSRCQATCPSPSYCPAVTGCVSNLICLPPNVTACTLWYSVTCSYQLP